MITMIPTTVPRKANLVIKLATANGSVTTLSTKRRGNVIKQTSLPNLRPQFLPPGQHPLHQGPHAQLAGDGEGLDQANSSSKALALSLLLRLYSMVAIMG